MTQVLSKFNREINLKVISMSYWNLMIFRTAPMKIILKWVKWMLNKINAALESRYLTIRMNKIVLAPKRHFKVIKTQIRMIKIMMMTIVQKLLQTSIINNQFCNHVQEIKWISLIKWILQPYYQLDKDLESINF